MAKAPFSSGIRALQFLPLLIYWSFALWGLGSRKPVLLVLLFVCFSFGSFTVMPPALTGGLTFLPVTMTALLICFKEFILYRSGLERMAGVISRPGMLLFLFWLVTLFVTIFIPRLMAGEIIVVPMRGSGILMETALLAPSRQNISQMANITISVFTVFALFQMLQRPGMIAVFLKALFIGGATLVITGSLDLATSYVPGVGFLLEPFRTATYALLTEDTLRDGTRRIVGLMPEASSYGSFCISFMSFIYFLRPGLTDANLQRKALWLCAGLGLFAGLSTSSAAYVGLGVFSILASVEWLGRALGARRSARAGGRLIRLEALGIFAVLTVVCPLLVIYPALLDPVLTRIDVMVLQKGNTTSYLERNMWTWTSLEALWDSYLIGVGVGSTRASNGFVALFSTTGLLGLLLYYGFVLILLLRKIPEHTPPLARAIITAARLSFWPSFAITFLIGTLADFGAMGALRWAVIMAGFAMAASIGAPKISKVAPPKAPRRPGSDMMPV